MHVTRERLHVLDRCRGKDTVAEVEDVAGPAAGAGEDFVGRGEHAVERAEQQRRVEVALNGAVDADAVPRFVERRAPVRPDDVSAGRAPLAKTRSRTRRA